jgi:hypothetical protein
MPGLYIRGHVITRSGLFSCMVVVKSKLDTFIKLTRANGAEITLLSAVHEEIVE